MTGSGVILMAVFRPDADLLRRQVESVTMQTASDWACFVGIDGADPRTCSLLQDLVGDDPRFRVIDYAEKVGHYRNFERLTAEVPRSVSWIAYCDQDDYWYPEKIERLLSVMEEEPAASAVVGAARVIDRVGNVLEVARRKPGSCPELLFRNEVTGSFAVFRRDVIELALPFPEGTRAAVHDHWLGVCAAALGQIASYREPLQDYVQHGGNVIGEATLARNVARIRAAGGDGSIAKRVDSVSYQLWGWRVSMARTLLSRLDDHWDGLAEAIRPVASGRLSFVLARRLMSAVVAGHLSPAKAVSMGLAALWWPRASRTANQSAAAGRQTDR